MLYRPDPRKAGNWRLTGSLCLYYAKLIKRPGFQHLKSKFAVKVRLSWLMASLWSYFSSTDTEQNTSNSTTMASLILNDGTVFRGKVFGAAKSVSGEVGEYFRETFLMS